MNLRTQKRIAAEVMGVGVNKVNILPEHSEEVSEALTREDIRILIHKGFISKKKEASPSKSRIRLKKQQKSKGRLRGHGRRSGKSTAREPKKEAWMKKIRAIRDEIRKLKEAGEIGEGEYRKIYRQAKGNLFHSRRHLREQVVKTKK